MTKALSILINTSWVTSLLILLIFFLRFMFKGNLNARLQYTLWIIVALRLVIPFSFQWTIETKSSIPQVQIINFAFDRNGNGDQNDIHSSFVVSNMGSHIDMSNNQPKQRTITLYEGLFMLWIFGAIGVLAVFIIRNITFYKKTMASIIPYSLSENVYRETAKIVGLKHRVPVYLSLNLTSPCVMGVFNPAIVLTQRVIHDDEATKLAIIHEMIHCKQRDNLIRLMGNILCAFHWFNPLVWLAAEAARNDAELSCDSRVMEKISSREHYNYCLTLLSAVGRSNHAVAAMSTGGRKLKKRIDMIIKPPKNHAIAILVGITCLVFGASSYINISVKAESKTSHILAEKGSIEKYNEIISLGNIYDVYQLLASLPNPSANYKINTIIINNEDQFKSLYLGYEFSKSDSASGLNDGEVKTLNTNALGLFASIPDLKYIRISYIDKLANISVPNTKAPTSYTYHRSQIKVKSDDLDANIENLSITPRIDNRFDQSMGNNNVLLVYGHSEFFSKIGIEEREYVENSITVSKLFSKLGIYKDRWKSNKHTMYRFSPNPVYDGWVDPMIITDEFDKIQGHGFILSNFNNR